MNNPFENALAQLERATSLVAFDEKFLAQIQHPNRQVRVSIPVVMDDGSLNVYEGYRVQYNNARGPYKGGIRFHQDADIEEVKALAFWMALKTAVVNIPMGGGKGGVTVNPKEMSEGEIEKLSRGWMRSMAEVIGPKKDVPAPDVNTTPQIMQWMADEFGKITGDTSGAVITGKPVDAGGSEGRGTATAQGGFYVFEALREQLGLPEQCSIAIQGFGNAGQFAAKIWAAAGHKIVAVSDSRGAIRNRDGLDVDELIEHKSSTRSVSGFVGAEDFDSIDVLYEPCDLLIPAALESQIREDNADRVQAKAVLELANGPTTPEADDLLLARNIPVVPDILANAGGVTVSTFEWEQNLKGEHWSEEDVFVRLKEIMVRESLAIASRAAELKTDLRRGAFVIALERIQEAMK
ncbi:Glu/Leu/Phe/Val dehydrogenase [Candidatus Uhrbacteria bacterium]|jgi:glutamate dehydrogenase (NAD(P)+)|nr:Glu/Leu/Phe/Val dehydrogenase [Candidatus Uhrbacteria bacterium]